MSDSAPNRPSTITTKMGPTTIRLRYSLIRRMRLRGCSTCQAKLNASSTFCTVVTIAYSRNTRPSEPSTVPWVLSMKSMTCAVISVARGPVGFRNS